MLLINREQISDIQILRLEGNVDIQTMTILQKEIDKIITEDTAKLIVDNRNLKYLSSTGIHMFLTLYKFFSDKNKHLIICGLNNVLDDIFEIAGLKQIFEIEADCKNAVKILL